MYINRRGHEKEIIMKKMLLLCLFSGGLLAAATFDKGGVAFDFAKFSAERFKAAELPRNNLITNADGRAVEGKYDPLRWRGSYCYIHSGAIPDKDPRRERVKKTVRWSVEDGIFTVVKPNSLKEFLPPELLKSTSGGWYKSVNLPHDKGGICRVELRYRTQIEGAGGVCLIASGYDRPAGKWGKAKRFFFKVYRLIPAGEWTDGFKEIEIPPGCVSLQLAFRMDGLGKMEFRNPSAVMKEQSSPRKKLTLKLTPMGFLDRTFVLAQGIPVTMCFMWKRNGAPAEAALEAPVLVVRLPREIAYHGSALLKCLEKKELPGGIEYRIDLRGVKRRPARMDSFDAYLLHPLLLTTDAPAGTRLEKGTAWVEEKCRRISNEETFSLKVIPAFQATAPRLFTLGFHGGGVYMQHKGKSIDICAETMKAAGVGWIISGNRDAFPAWRRAGVRYITPELFYVANGYKIGMPQKRPEADKYRFTGDSNAKLLGEATCPSAVYEKRPYFMNSTVPYIREALKGADGLWANWEPYAFAGRGCFCDTCRRKFAEFVGVSEEQMKKEWPRELAPGRKYHKQAVRFRSLEHAKLMRTINETVTAATGGEKSLGFIPGVQVDDMSSTWREHKFDAENHPIDYASSFKWIDPWGPYSHWDAAVNPYIYSKIFSLRIFTKAREVRLAVNKDYPLPHRPKLLAFPHGHQGTSRLTHPESLKLDILTYFFNGWEAATVYYFPRGYDARWWRAFAEAATVTARYEDYVFNGKRADERISLSPLQPFASETVISDHLLGRRRKFSLLQHTAWEKGDSLIAAVFDFWYHGEVFFTCKVKGLAPERRYTVTANGVRFADAQGKNFTGRDLASGVTLHAGAVRCVVYEIAPEKASDKALPALKPADVEKLRQAALPALRKAKAVDDLYEKNNSFQESELKVLSNAGIAGLFDKAKGLHTFRSGEMSAVVHVPSCSVISWESGSKKLISGGRGAGAAGAAFWTPTVSLFRDGFVVEQRKIPGGIELVGKRTVRSNEQPALAELRVVQTIRFTDGLNRIAVATTLVNGSDKTVSFGFRSNCVPAAPGLEGGFTQIAVDGKPLRLERDNSRHIYTTGADGQFGSVARKLFEVVKPTGRIDAAPVWFISPGVRLRMTFAPAKELAGVACWDSGNMQAPTFEPCFKTVSLGKGKEVTYSTVFSLK